MNMPVSLEYPAAGLAQVLAGAARSFADRIAVRDGEETRTFAELYDHALRTAGGPRERGIGQGDVVALHTPNSSWYVVTYYGAICAGVVVAPVNPAQPQHALADQSEAVAVKSVVTHPACAAALAEAGIVGLRRVVVVPGTETAPAGSAVAPAGSVPLADLLTAAPSPGTPRIRTGTLISS